MKKEIKLEIIAIAGSSFQKDLIYSILQNIGKAVTHFINFRHKKNKAVFFIHSNP